MPTVEAEHRQGILAATRGGCEPASQRYAPPLRTSYRLLGVRHKGRGTQAVGKQAMPSRLCPAARRRCTIRGSELPGTRRVMERAARRQRFWAPQGGEVLGQRLTSTGKVLAPELRRADTARWAYAGGSVLAHRAAAAAAAAAPAAWARIGGDCSPRDGQRPCCHRAGRCWRRRPARAALKGKRISDAACGRVRVVEAAAGEERPLIPPVHTQG